MHRRRAQNTNTQKRVEEGAPGEVGLYAGEEGEYPGEVGEPGDVGLYPALRSLVAGLRY